MDATKIEERVGEIAVAIVVFGSGIPGEHTFRLVNQSIS
jgi:hypothetical protein